MPDTQRLGTSSDLVTPSLALSGLAVPESVPSHLEPSHGLVSPLQNKDGSYTGFIKVQLKLVRPVSVPSSKKPPSLQDARRGPGRGTAVRRRTSFYLPKDAVKHLHVLSRTRAREVIEALLRKFLVVDDPRKFALFERAERHGQGGLSTPPHLCVRVYMHAPVHAGAEGVGPDSNQILSSP